MDVVVVGAGVAGSMVAWKLAEAGLGVWLVESGPRVRRAEAVARFLQGGEPYPDVKQAPRPRTDDLNHHLHQAGPELFYGTYERRVGGSTWHWLGTTLRMLDGDLNLQSRYGVGLDWPIGLADLEPYYDQAERELGVAGPSGPQPAHALTTVDRAVEAAAGRPIQALPQARNSVNYDGRPACCGSASCIPICPIGAKYDASVHAAKALAAGARLVQGTVGRLEARSNRVVAAELVGGDRIPADLFVVAANGIETPRLLLLSGLGGAQVGRNLMGATAQLSWALAHQPVDAYRGPQATAGFLDWRDGPHRRRHAGFVVSVANDGWPHQPPPKVAEGLIARGLRGRDLREAVADRLSRQVALVSTCEELPMAENRVTLAPFRDSLGLPRPAVHYAVGEYTRRALEPARDFHRQVLERLGSEVGHSVGADSAYLVGACRMGTEPAQAVVDSNLCCFGLPNLMLVGQA
ncbi:MAG: GMC family oxidoreductase, partial [Candidatus Eremiobacteraeota bacterium]|nr:GMC family oxidoreductase [Candidatus Eremiobacteraeota bacterium]